MIAGRVTDVLVAVAMLALAGPKATAKPVPDTRQKVWAIRFDQFLKEPPDWTAVERHETQALAFSPDGKRLAVTLAHHQRVSERNSISIRIFSSFRSTLQRQTFNSSTSPRRVVSI
jgi:hypothetical protein